MRDDGGTQKTENSSEIAPTYLELMNSGPAGYC